MCVSAAIYNSVSMHVQQCSRWGPYEILDKLGAGGMGEVYLARDTRLGRTVAIKVVAAALATSPEARRRFEQEARAVAALNHPHICVLYDVGREGAVDFLVMEYLEGRTLAARLARGPLGIDEALSCAIDVAQALAVAHRERVCHRDLKPGNIMLTRSGAKVLDFGLARIAEDGQGAVVSGDTPTEAGAVVGTLPYMAPEQLAG